MTYEQNMIAMEEGKDDTDIPLKSLTGVRRESAVHTTKRMVSRKSHDKNYRNEHLQSCYKVNSTHTLWE